MGCGLRIYLSILLRDNAFKATIYIRVGGSSVIVIPELFLSMAVKGIQFIHWGSVWFKSAINGESI